MADNGKRGDFSELFGKFIHFAIIFAIIVVIILAVVFLINVWRTGAASTIVNEGLIALDETGEPMKKGVSGFWDFFWNPSEISNQFKWESEVVEYEGVEELGVEIINFETNRKFLSNEPIQISGLVKGASINDDGMNLRFLCELEDYEGEIIASPSEVDIYGKGVVRNHEVACLFADGIKATKQQISKKATFKAEYDFLTQSTYRLYFMDSDLLDSFLSQGLDPFVNNHYNVADDLLLKPTNVMRSQITEGPIDLRLSSETSQPFSQSSNFVIFNVDLITKESGNLKNVNSLKLYVPFAIDFSRDVRFCDFEDTGEIEGQFKIYEISEAVLNDKVNVDCSNNQFYEVESDCIDDYSDVELSCSFAVSQLPEGDLFFKSLIKAEVEYVFEVEKKEAITVLGVEEFSDICEDISDETECISTVGCMPSSSGEFESCISCPLAWTNCEAYEDELSCSNDWCGFGECNFIEDSCLS